MMDALNMLDALFEKMRDEKDPVAFAEALLSAPYRGNEEMIVSLLDAYSDNNDTVSHYVIGLIGTLVAENPNQEKLYRGLHAGIFGDALIDEEQKKCALLWASINNQIPYHQLSVISMEEEEFGKRFAELKPEVERIRQFALRPFNQKTEKASAFLDVIESEDDERDRAILMVAAIDAVQSALQNQQD